MSTATGSLPSPTAAPLHLPSPRALRWSACHARRAAYALLVCLIAASVALSVLIERSSGTGMTRLVHLFDVVALLTGGFLLYHVRARFRVEQQLAHQAGHDPLTGLAHRRSFEARLRSLPARPHAVVLCTIDRFSRIVGGYGHVSATA